MKLSSFNNEGFDRGASRLKEAIWIFVSSFSLSSSLPGSAWRRFILRLFGAKVGQGVIIKPRVRVKFPWRLHIGDHSWIGEEAWIDNLAVVSIGSDVCISQGVYICTGNHNWSKSTFDLTTSSITIEDCCWLSAKSILAPGSYMSEGAVLGVGMVGAGTLEAWKIYSLKKPAPVKDRSKHQQ